MQQQHLQKSKRSKLFIIIGYIVGFILICGIVINTKRRESRLQKINSDNPQIVVDTFLDAIRENDLRLAKELITLDQQEHIDEWIAISNHKPFDCPIEWGRGLGAFIEPIAGGVGGQYETENNTISVDSSYFCYNNGSSIRIEGAIVNYNENKWKITGWDKICESSPEYASQEICCP